MFVGSGLYSYVAVGLDAEKGTELWRTDLKLRAFGAPIAIGQVRLLRHRHREHGVRHLRVPGRERQERGFTGRRGRLPRSGNGQGGVALSICRARFTRAWRATRSASTRAVATGSSTAIDRKTGKLRWKTGIGGAITAPPAIATASGMPVAVYAVSQEGIATCLNPHTGKIAWQQSLPGFRWDGHGENGVFCGPTLATTPTPTGSKRAIYIGAMTVDPFNPAKKTAAVFRLEDEIGRSDDSSCRFPLTSSPAWRTGTFILSGANFPPIESPPRSGW